jgi:hypothetical protein
MGNKKEITRERNKINPQYGVRCLVGTRKASPPLNSPQYPIWSPGPCKPQRDIIWEAKEEITYFFLIGYTSLL